MRPPSLAAARAGLILLAVVVAACGGDPEAGSPPGAKGVPAERAFLAAMVPHHRSAIDMAGVAEAEAETAFVKELAGEITASQTREIARMERIHRRLFGAPIRPDTGGHMALGLTAGEAGMGHMDAAAAMRGRRPVDRAFVEEMVPHHRGATKMAEAVLEKGRDPELRRLAEDILSAQEKEIAEMSDFRRREYGGRVPAAGAREG